MALVAIIEEVEKEANELIDVDIHALSLVSQGANRSPWRIVKRAEQEATMEGLALHSVILPKGMSVEDLLKLEKFAGWVPLAKGTAAKLDTGQERYEVMPADRFDPATLVAGYCSKGIFAIAGKLSKADPTAIEVGKDMFVSPLDMDLPDPNAQPIVPPAQKLYEAVGREFDGLRALVFGALEQSAADPGARLATIRGALAAFQTFVEDALGALEKDNDKGKQEGVAMTAEERIALIEEIKKSTDESLVALRDELKKEIEDFSVGVKAKLDEAAEKIDGIEKRAEKVENTLVGKSGADDKPQVVKAAENSDNDLPWYKQQTPKVAAVLAAS